MAITKKQKEASIAELTELISNSKNIIVWEYLGLSSNDQSQLRANIRRANGFNKVFKNRLAKIAFEKAGKKEIAEVLTGSSSFLFINDDESTALKELHKVIKENDNLSYKGGYIDGEYYDGDAILAVAGLPSKEDLLSMLLSVLQANIRNLAYSLSQVAEQKPDEATSKDAAKTEEPKVEVEETKPEESAVAEEAKPEEAAPAEESKEESAEKAE